MPSDRLPRRLRLVLLLLLAVAGTALLFLPVRPLAEAALQWTRDAGGWGMLVLGVVYAVATLLMLPCWPLGVVAGFLFGIPYGLLTVSVASTLGATGSCLLGRTLARGWVEEALAGRPAFRRLDSLVAERGFSIVLISRLALILPYNLLNYAYGLTRVRLRDYVLGSWLGMLPGTALFVSAGAAVETASQVAAGKIPPSPTRSAMVVLGLLASVILVIWCGRLARKALREAEPGDEREETDK